MMKMGGKKFLFIFVLMGLAIKAYAQDQPNIIVILTDDQGWADVGFNGGTDIPTPNLDRIASEGVVFSNGYVTHPYCSPSRAGLQDDIRPDLVMIAICLTKVRMDQQ